MNCMLNLRAGHGWGPKDVCYLVRRLTATEGAAGQQPVIRYDRVPARDKLGRFGHATGIGFMGRVTFTGVAATMPAAMPGTLVESLLSQIQLTAAGRQYLVSIDGNDLRDDMLFREGVSLTAPVQDIADADATGTRDLSMWWTFGRPHHNERDGARALDCALPLSLFNANADAEAGLRVLIDTAPRSGGGDVDAFPGVTSTGFITAGQELEFYLIVRYEDEMHVDVPWNLRRVAGPELSGRYAVGALCHYAVVRDRVDDDADAASWVPDETDYGTIEVTVGDEKLIAGQEGQTARAVSRKQNGVSFVGCDTELGANRINNDTTQTFIALVWAVAGSRRVALANGDLSWNFGARTNHQRTRILMRGYGDYDMSIEVKARSCMPGLPADAVRITSSATPSGKAGKVSPILPVAIGIPDANGKAA